MPGPQCAKCTGVAVNAWIRESGVFDVPPISTPRCGDSEIPTQMRAVDDCGDGLHPSDCGYYNVGDRARAGR